MLVASATTLRPDFSILIRQQNDEKLARAAKSPPPSNHGALKTRSRVEFTTLRCDWVEEISRSARND
jgi:hypothetical protein